MVDVPSNHGRILLPPRRGEDTAPYLFCNRVGRAVPGPPGFDRLPCSSSYFRPMLCDGISQHSDNSEQEQREGEEHCSRADPPLFEFAGHARKKQNCGK